MKNRKCTHLHELALFTLLTLFLTIFTVGQVPGDLIIAEVMADPSSGAGLGEPDNEYFVVCNRSGTDRNLNGWTAIDNGTDAIALPNYLLKSGTCAAIANTAIDLTAAGYNCAVAPLNVFPSASWFSNNLANSNDNIGLFSPASVLIDGVSYGTDTTYLNPSAPDVFNNTSAALIRTGYPSAGVNSLPDTDTNADWDSRTGTPCDVPMDTTAALGSIQGRARTADGSGLIFVVAMLTGGSLPGPIYATTNHFGHYSFESIPVGESYVLQVISARYVFKTPSRVINLKQSVTGVDFVGEGIVTQAIISDDIAGSGKLRPDF